MGTADNTGSSVKFANMAHENGLIKLVLGTRSIPTTRIFKANTTDVYRDARTTSITLPTTCTGTNTPYVNGSNSFVIGKPSTSSVTIASTGVNSANRYLNWTISGKYTKNNASILTPGSTRGYVYYGRAYDYTGNVQTFTASEAGTYKLEVWGAQGAKGLLAGGKGGYSSGNQDLNKNYSLYVCCGGAGKADTGTGYTANTQNPGGVGGYNGGGNGGKGYQDPFFNYRIIGGGGGGGCTHIATVNRGELYNYEDYKNEVLLVAGGGGGGSHGVVGGFGGGISGGTSIFNTYTSEGGTQTTGYMFGKGQQGMDKTINGNNGGEGNGGGGGGWYGGLSKQVQGDGSAVGGGGGSGHVGDVSNGQTIAGNETFSSPSGGTETGHPGNGYAIITQVSY